MVENYISGRKVNEKADTVPVVVRDEENEKSAQNRVTIRFITNFLEGDINKKNRKAFKYL